MRLLERIKRAFTANKVEFWEERPKNLTREELKTTFDYAPELTMQRKQRKSGDGVHGLDGEDFVYAGKMTVGAFGKLKEFYLKFFFWKKNDPIGEQGIEVQSFKPWEENDV